MIERMKAENMVTSFRDASVVGSPLKEAFEKAKDSMEKKQIRAVIDVNVFEPEAGVE